jgi:hypothetical protein
MHSHIKIAETLTDLLENRFNIAGFRFGLDPVLGVIPAIGDLIPFFLSFYMIWIAKKLHIPEHKINEMRKNIIVDLFIGFVPLLGDIGDVFYRANSKNLAILKQHYPRQVEEGKIIKN